MTDDPTGSVRKPALDVESDGLDCFATEAVREIETADDPAAAEVVEPPAALPTIGAGALDGWRRGQRGEFAKASVVIVLVLGLAVLTNRILDERAARVNGPADVPEQSPRTPAASPNASATAQPVAPHAVETGPAVDARDTPSPRPAEVARVEPPATASPRPPATRETFVPVLPSSPDASARPVLPSFAAIETPIVAPAPDVGRPEPAAETRALAAPAVIVPPSDRSSIERVLEAYRDAYDRLDAPSAAVIWPRVDTRALSRAFSTLARQDVLFDSCDLEIAGAQAIARCVGEIRYVRRVGDQVPRVRRMSWSFALERVTNRWQIARVTAD